jgi:hypothetical protein
MFNDKPLCLLIDEDYFPQELAEKLLSECLFNGDYDDFIVELFREEALQSKRDFRNGFCDAYAIPMDMFSEVVAGFAHKVKFDNDFSKDDAFFTADIVGEEVVIKSHKFGDIVAYYRDEVVEWAADDLPSMFYDELWMEKEERRAYYEEEVLPRKLKELEWERSAAMRDFI